MNDNNDDWEKIRPDDAARQRMLNNILQPGKKRRANAVTRLSPAVLIVATVVVCLSAATAFAMSLGWHEKLMDFLNPTAAQIDELAGNVSFHEVSAADNGVTVTLKQTIVDGMGVYALSEITAPGWLEFNDDITFRAYELDFEADWIAIRSDSAIVLDQNGNERTELFYAATTGSISKNSPAQLLLEDLGYYDEDPDTNEIKFHTLVEGSWALDWELDYSADIVKTIEVYQPVDITGTNNNIVTTISISPMSVLIRVKGDDLWTALHPVINMTNGDKIRIDAVNNFNMVYIWRGLDDEERLDGGDSTYGEYIMAYRFGRITDITDIESIVIGNVTVPIS